MDEKQKWLLASTALNLLFSLAKLWVGWKLGSTLVTADGIHSLSDVFGSFLILVALRIASRSFSLFPIGLNKLEDLASLAGAIAIFVAGYEIVRSVFVENSLAISDSMGIIILFVTLIVIIETIFYYYEKKAAKRLNSPGVETDAVNWLGDIGAGVVVIVGLLGTMVHLPYAQEAAVIIIVGLIFQGGYEILKTSLLSLLDASADQAIIDHARTLITQNPEIAAIDSLMIRRSGSIYIGELSLQIKENNAKKAHQIIDAIEDQLKKAINGLEIVTIHYAPIAYPTIVRALLLFEDNTISTQLGKTALIRFETLDHEGHILSSENFPIVHSSDAKTKPVKLIATLILKHVDEVIFGGEHNDLVMLLDALGIAVKKDTILKQGMT